MKRGRLLYFLLSKRFEVKEADFFLFLLSQKLPLFSLLLFSPDYLTFSQILILKILFIFHFFLYFLGCSSMKDLRYLIGIFISFILPFSNRANLYLCFGGRGSSWILLFAHYTHFTFSCFFQVELLRMIAKLFRRFSWDILPWLDKEAIQFSILSS